MKKIFFVMTLIGILSVSFAPGSKAYAQGDEIDQMLNRGFDFCGGIMAGNIGANLAKIQPGNSEVVTWERSWTGANGHDDFEYPVYFAARDFVNPMIMDPVHVYFHGKSAAETLAALIRSHYPTYDLNTVHAKVLAAIVNEVVNQGGFFNAGKYPRGPEGAAADGVVQVQFIVHRRDKTALDLRGSGATFNEALEKALTLNSADFPALLKEQQKIAMLLKTDTGQQCKKNANLLALLAAIQNTAGVDRGKLIASLIDEDGLSDCVTLGDFLVHGSTLRNYFKHRRAADRNGTAIIFQ